MKKSNDLFSKMMKVINDFEKKEEEKNDPDCCDNKNIDEMNICMNCGTLNYWDGVTFVNEIERDIDPHRHYNGVKPLAKKRAQCRKSYFIRLCYAYLNTGFCAAESVLDKYKTSERNKFRLSEVCAIYKLDSELKSKKKDVSQIISAFYYLNGISTPSVSICDMIEELELLEKKTKCRYKQAIRNSMEKKGHAELCHLLFDKEKKRKNKKKSHGAVACA